METNPIEKIQTWLAPYPANRVAFDHCIGHLVPRAGYSLAVTGSLVTGDVDRYSDLDFILLLAGHLEVEDVQGEIDRFLPLIGKPLAAFRATHLNLPNLQIFYLDVDSWVVKIDIEVYAATETVKLPEKLQVLHDPEGFFKEREAFPIRNAVDFPMLPQKFCGWLWYTYTKIKRGEYFHAARSIDYTREHAVLPCLMYLNGLPQDGHRRIESRLDPENLERLYNSYPVKLERRELMRALLSVADHFMSFQNEMITAFPETRPADVERMLAIIVEQERLSGE
jgi:hypothetical protein